MFPFIVPVEVRFPFLRFDDYCYSLSTYYRLTYPRDVYVEKFWVFSIYFSRDLYYCNWVLGRESVLW